MPAWSRRAEGRCKAVSAAINIHSMHQVRNAPSEPLRFLTFNIQVGIKTTGYGEYLTKGWKHLLPHGDRTHNLRRIADLVADYDVVALQEIDAGSIRSGFVNQVEYLADRAQFPYWYTQLNRDLGPFAQHGNGLLSRIPPIEMEDHKLPGAIPGRGAIVVRLPWGDEQVLLVLLHLSLGDRSRQRQLEYVRALIDNEPNVVLMGDMNSHLSELLFNSPLADTDLMPAEQIDPTYPAWRPFLALDHVLVSPGLTIRDYEVLDCQLSDHRPIAVTLDFTGEKRRSQ
ncbi:MAG: endonuclease/exonuclease/phosphatase family protein [Gammaproteobacteria bacterium]|nr:endonuclease/exonuclease/phosphatase family protein [Gammaproteobacteria bacterium]